MIPGYCGGELAEDALPERVAVGHGVALVGHADLGQAARLRELEGVADDAVHAFVGVQLFLDRDLVLGAGLEPAADADIEPLGVLAKDDEVDVGRAAVLERAETLVEEAHRPVVDVEVELEARAEEDVARVAIVGHARIAQRADENRVEPAQEIVAARRHRHAGLQVVVGAPRQVLEVEPPSEPLADRRQHFDGLGGDVLADAVAGDECDAHG